jgi:hypothetical protein
MSPKSSTLGLLDEALREARKLAARITEPGRAESEGLPVIDTALALARPTGLTGKVEVSWLRSRLTDCAPIVGPPEGGRSD